MTLVVLAAVVATVLGFAFRGSLARFGRPKLRRGGLLAFAVLAQVTALLAQHPGVYAGWLAGGVIALIVFARVNRGRPGLLLAAAGLVANVVVIVANWGMPVDVVAADRARVPASRLDLSDDVLRTAVDDDTVLPWLGRSVPLALPLWPDVASPGDVLTAAGTAVFVFTGLTGRGRAAPAPTVRGGKRTRGGRRAEATAQIPTVALVEGAGATAVNGNPEVEQIQSPDRSPVKWADVGTTATLAVVAPVSDSDEELATRPGTQANELVSVRSGVVDDVAAGLDSTAVDTLDIGAVDTDPRGIVVADSVLPDAPAETVSPAENGGYAVHVGSGAAAVASAPIPAEVAALGAVSDHTTVGSSTTGRADARRTTTRPAGRGAKRAPVGSEARSSHSGRRVAGRPGPVASGSHAVGDVAAVSTSDTDAERTARRRDRKRSKRQARQERKSVASAAAKTVGSQAAETVGSQAAETASAARKESTGGATNSPPKSSAPDPPTVRQRPASPPVSDGTDRAQATESTPARARPAPPEGPPKAWQI